MILLPGKVVQSAKCKVQGTSKYSSGQAVLVVLLSLSVALVIVLSVVSRSITDIGVSSKNEESTRAFSAAEAGVEQALIVGSDIGETTIGSASFRVSVENFAMGTQTFIYPQDLVSGNSAFFWLVNHDDSGNIICDSARRPCFRGRDLSVCWGQTGASPSPAVEISIFYDTTPGPTPPGNYADVRIARITADPDGARSATNHFGGTDGTCTLGSESFSYRKNINLASLGVPAAVYNANPGYGLLYLKVRMLYNTAPDRVALSVGGSSIIPSQGKSIESVGNAGDATRKLNVFQSYGNIPPIFDSAVFTLGGLTKSL
jgi:hypothetical protein